MPNHFLPRSRRLLASAGLVDTLRRTIHAMSSSTRSGGSEAHFEDSSLWHIQNRSLFDLILFALICFAASLVNARRQIDRWWTEPPSDVIDIWHGSTDGHEANMSSPCTHAGDDDFERWSARLAKYMNLRNVSLKSFLQFQLTSSIMMRASRSRAPLIRVPARVIASHFSG